MGLDEEGEEKEEELDELDSNEEEEGGCSDASSDEDGGDGDDNFEDDRGGDESSGDEREIAMLRKTWTSEASDTYYSAVRIGAKGGRKGAAGGDTYYCGDCVMMETTSGKYPAEILYIFKDRYGDEWVEVRWLYTKDEIEETVPKSRCPDIDDAELLETNDVIANHPGAIAYPVTVHSEEDYRQMEKAAVEEELDDGRHFFCRASYDVRLKRFMPERGQRPAQRLLRGRRFSERPPRPDESDTSSSSSGSGSDGDEDEEEEEDVDEDEDGRGGGGGSAATGDNGDDPAFDSRRKRHSKKRRSSSIGGGGSRGKRSRRLPQDKFSVAMDSLHVTAVPKSLPCRTAERNQLLSFLTSNIKAGGLGNALFVAGMPGTGKTATAHEVVRVLKEQQARGLLPSFKLVELNGMRLQEPHQAYPQLWMALSGEMLSPKRALSRLERYFSKGDPSREFVVLLVDELDYMTTRKQTVLYNLFEWPSRRNARLVVVGIANTIDLPERCLPRVSSRVTSRLTFGPYQKQQLAEILQARLVEANSIQGDGNAFNRGAINMAAAKVASSSGDMRMCLKYCRRAIEVCKARVESAQAEGTGDQVSCEVSVDDVHRAVREITEQAHLLAVRDSAPQERLLLVAITNEVHLGGKGVVDMEDVCLRMEAICRAHPNGPRMPVETTILEMMSRLSASQVVDLDLSRRTPLPDVQLNMSVREVVQMLRDDEAFSRKVLPEALVSDAKEHSTKQSGLPDDSTETSVGGNMWRPNEVVKRHRCRAAILWMSIITGVFVYASLLFAHARRRQKNPSMSFAFRDVYYKYPDMGVCLNGFFGCDEFFLTEACAMSSNMTEGVSRNATFFSGWDSERVSSVVEPSPDGTAWCVNFKTSKVLEKVGQERTPDDTADFFEIELSWFPGGAAGASTTCVADEGTWKPHRELVFFYLTDPETGSRSVAAVVPYTCVTNSTLSFISNYVGIGLTRKEKLRGGDETEYTTNRVTSGSYKTTRKPDLQHPYAHVALVIHQQTNSLEVVTEVDPLDIAEIFGNIGGFWDLLMVFWPLFFVAMSTQNPSLKLRNFRKSLKRGTEAAVVVTASTSKRLTGSFRRSGSGTMSSSGRSKIGSRRGSFASTVETSGGSRPGSFRHSTSSKSTGGSFSSSAGGEFKSDALDQSGDAAPGSVQQIVKLADTKA
eukprot:g14231.t1